jgi:hypothetical protein
MTVAEPEIRNEARPTPMGTRPGDGADDPVTGPMPAIELHDGRVRVHVERDVTVASLDGGLDAAFAGEVVPTLPGALAGALAVVLDIDQVALLDREAFDSVLDAFTAATDGLERCIVASRLSGRMVLERWGVTDHHAVFTSVADALQARAFVANGYGEGWQHS